MKRLSLAKSLLLASAVLLIASPAHAQEQKNYLRLELPRSMVVIPPPLYDDISIDVSPLVQSRPGIPLLIPLTVTGGDPSIRTSLRGAAAGISIANNGADIAVASSLTGASDFFVVHGNAEAPVHLQIEDLRASIAARTDTEAKANVRIEPTSSGVFGTAQWSFQNKPANWPSTLVLDEATGIISGTASNPISVTGATLRLRNSGDAASIVTNPFRIEVAGASCLSPWGTSTLHGQQLTYYSQATVPYYQTCTSVATTINCNNGAFPTIPSSALQSCEPDNEAGYAAGATARAADIKAAAEAMTAAMRQAIPYSGCANNTWCYPLSNIVARGWLPSMVTVNSTNDVTFLTGGVRFSFKSISRYAPDNMQFHAQDVRKSDCMAILANPPNRMWNVSHGGSQAQVATLNTEAARNAFCSASATTLSMFFYQ